MAMMPKRVKFRKSQRGKVKGRASLGLHFSAVAVANRDETTPIDADVSFVSESSKSDDVKKIAIPAAGGAAVGAIIGGKKGAAIGGAIGGGAGTAVVLSTSGDEVASHSRCRRSTSSGSSVPPVSIRLLQRFRAIAVSSVVEPGGDPIHGSSKAGMGSGTVRARRNSKGAPRASPSASPRMLPAMRSATASTRGIFAGRWYRR